MTRRILCALLLGMVTVFVPAAARANGVPFIYQPLSPSSVAPGGADFTLTVSGTGFISNAVINWNGSPRTTTFLSSSKLSASIFASDIASAGTALITVTNPASGGGTSNSLPFQVASPTVGLSFQDNVLPAGVGGLAISHFDVGDFNGDGKLDLVVSNFLLDTVNLFLGNGDGTFQSPVPITVVPPPTRLISFGLGDVNGDGKPDLIASYFDQNVTPNVIGTSVAIQNGDGTFQPVKTTPGLSIIGSVLVVADFNGDGKPDIASFFGNQITFGLGNGDGTFSPNVIFTSPVNVNGGPAINSLAVGDFNGDGKLDIAFVAVPKYLAILFGNGDGTFGPPSLVYDTGFGADAVTAADFNGDGKLDLALYHPQNIQSDANGTLSIFAGNGDGTFQDPVTLTGLPESSSLTMFALSDLNTDGHLDLIAQNMALLLGNGTGPFSHTQIAIPSFASVTADFDGDGKPDLLGFAGGFNLHLMLQTPPPPDFSGSVNPSFQSVAPGSSATYTVSVSSIDGFAGAVQFSSSGLPAGATATFSPATITSSGSTTLAVSTSNSTPSGSYTVTLTGISGSIVHVGTFILNVGTPGTDFSDFAGSLTPSYQTITPGSVTHYDLGISPLNGFTGTVTFSVSGLPSGATASFAPSSISGGLGTSTLNVTTSVGTPTGTYALVVTATGGSHVHSTAVNLNVGPAGTDFTDFTGFITPQSQTVARGGVANFTLTTVPINGFNEDLHLGSGGTPTGVSITASSLSIRGGSGSSTITISPGPQATPGTYTITIGAIGDAKHIHSKDITLTITP